MLSKDGRKPFAPLIARAKLESQEELSLAELAEGYSKRCEAAGTPPKRQKLSFSATQLKDFRAVTALTQKFLRNPMSLEIARDGHRTGIPMRPSFQDITRSPL